MRIVRKLLSGRRHVGHPENNLRRRYVRGKVATLIRWVEAGRRGLQRVIATRLVLYPRTNSPIMGPNHNMIYNTMDCAKASEVPHGPYCGMASQFS
jgi:hypothetical protein